MPANTFIDDGTGSNRFAAYNLTIAYPVWGLPVVPAELTMNDEFTEALNGQVVTATSILQSDYAARDSHFTSAAAMLPAVAAAVTAVRNAVTTARAAMTEAGPVLPLFDSCNGAINITVRRTQTAMENRGSEQYARITALLPSGEDRLNSLLESCIDGLNGRIGDPQIASAGEQLRAVTSALMSEFNMIDDNKAAMDAEAEMAYVKRTLNTLLYEVNAFAVSPAVMFDAARLSGGVTPIARYGIGGGLRFTLISHVSFTVGYLVNPTRDLNEPRGALSFSLQFRDLFN
jgi:hypothetical protein